MTSFPHTQLLHSSHELRTPLNCAFLGLKVLRTKFESADTPADRTALEMLVDVDQSCAAALDVLNGATVPALTYMPLLSCSSHLLSYLGPYIIPI